MTEGNKRISRRILEEVFGQGNWATADELVAADCVAHDSAAPEPIRGPEGLRQAAGGYRAAFGDLQVEVTTQLAEGDLVTTAWTASGTHSGDLFGISPTGVHASTSGITIDRIEHGQIVESWTQWDTLGLMQKIGAIPAPAMA